MELETFFKVAPIVSQIFIGLAIIISGRSIARAQYSKSIQDEWQDYNKIVRSHPDNIQLVRET
ncbi:MAG: hypothetical protein AAGG51_28020 [Cyanobacteria bacterium P01_G01_bin.54]